MERMEINLSIMTKDQLKKFIVELEKENKNLKEMCGKLWEMNGKLWERVNNLEEENKKLKEKLNKAWLEEYWFFNEY